jgi:hypothetical protein
MEEGLLSPWPLWNWNSDDACIDPVRDDPKLLVRMRAETTAVEARRWLINTPQWPEGFSRLWEVKRLDLTVEAFVDANPKFRPRFDPPTSDKLRAEAR